MFKADDLNNGEKPFLNWTLNLKTIQFWEGIVGNTLFTGINRFSYPLQLKNFTPLMY